MKFTYDLFNHFNFTPQTGISNMIRLTSGIVPAKIWLHECNFELCCDTLSNPHCLGIPTDILFTFYSAFHASQLSHSDYPQASVP